MKNNKLFSTVLLVLLVCLSLVVSASAAETDLIFTLESPDSSVEELGTSVVDAGETFTVAVNIEQNPGFLAAIGYVTYNSEELELVNVKALVNNVTVPVAPGCVTVIVGNTSAAFTPAKCEVVTSTGAVVELTFKALSKVDSVAEVALAVSSSNMIDKDGKYSFNSISESLKVNVVAADHTCDVDTIDANTGKEATCTEEGKETDLLCAHCGKVAKEGAVIPALGHAWDNGVETKAPTCTDMGVITYTCGNCGETKVDDKVPAIGHSFGNWTVTKEATADAEGEETRTCANCQAKETRSIAKLPAPAPAPEKSNTGLIIAIVVVVVLAGAGAAAFFVLKNKKK